MTNAPLLAAVEKIEAWLADPTWEPDPEALAEWNAGFQAAKAATERGADRTEITARAHAAGAALELRLARLLAQRDALKAELDAQALGGRALRGYRMNLA